MRNARMFEKSLPLKYLTTGIHTSRLFAVWLVSEAGDASGFAHPGLIPIGSRSSLHRGMIFLTLGGRG